MGSQVKLEDLTPGDESDEPRGDKPLRAESARTKSRKAATSARAESQLRERLSGVIDRIASTLETRGDEQLAEVIREDAEIMAGGLVSMTRPLKALRTPLLIILAVVEPALAFGRVFRVVVERAADRRAENAQRAALARDESNDGNG